MALADIVECLYVTFFSSLLQPKEIERCSSLRAARVVLDSDSVSLLILDTSFPVGQRAQIHDSTQDDFGQAAGRRVVPGRLPFSPATARSGKATRQGEAVAMIDLMPRSVVIDVHCCYTPLVRVLFCVTFYMVFHATS